MESQSRMVHPDVGIMCTLTHLKQNASLVVVLAQAEIPLPPLCLLITDVLWDGRQCGGAEITAVHHLTSRGSVKRSQRPSLKIWRLGYQCTDEDFDNENMAVESFGLYIQGRVNLNAVKRT